MTETISSQKKRGLFTNQNYQLLWFGQSLSLMGDYFFTATIAIWMIDQLARGESWLPLATGAVAMSGALPSLLLSPIAGVYVDRWNRRWTMIWTDLARMVLVMLFLLIVLLVTNRTILLISSLTILVLVASGSQFFLPARVAVVADVVPPEHHPQAYGSLQQAQYIAQIVGSAVAVPLYLALGPVWAITLNALSFLISFLVIFMMRVPVQETDMSHNHMGFWSEFIEGLHFFVRNRILVALLVCGMIYMFAGMAYNSFEYLYGIEKLHIPATLLGLYVACYGIGVVVGLPIMAALTKRLSEVEVLWISLVCDGITMLVLARVTTMLPGMGCGLLLGFFNASVFVTVRPLTVLVTPRKLIGRVMAFETPMIRMASLAGGFLASILASTLLSGFHATFAGITFHRLDTIFVAVGILTVGAGIFARLTLYKSVKALRVTDVKNFIAG